MHEPKLRERLQYAFDTVMSRGTVAIMGLLALGTLVFVFVIALIVMLLKASPKTPKRATSGTSCGAT